MNYYNRKKTISCVKVISCPTSPIYLDSILPSHLPSHSFLWQTSLITITNTVRNMITQTKYALFHRNFAETEMGDDLGNIHINNYWNYRNPHYPHKTQKHFIFLIIWKQLCSCKQCFVTVMSTLLTAVAVLVLSFEALQKLNYLWPSSFKW